MNFEKVFDLYNILIEEFFKNKSKEEIKEKSQYFTPLNIVDKMLSGVKFYQKDKIRILDPAVGGGILVLKLVEKILENCNPNIIEIDVYEIDEKALSIVKLLFEKLNIKKIKLNIYLENFLEIENLNRYDYIITNPPYKKTNIKYLDNSLKEFVNGQPNLYHLFIGKALNKLEKNGILIILSPKNYLGGKYTENLRKFILENFSIKKIHTFDERSKIFGNKIIQEICILHITNTFSKEIEISYNGNEKIITEIDKLILDDKKKIIMTPRNIQDIFIIDQFKKLANEHIKKNFDVRVGEVVQFRIKDKETTLQETTFFKHEKGVPLIVYRHINKGYFEYREIFEKNKNRAVTLINTKDNEKFLIDNKNYIFLKKNIDKSCLKLIVPVLYFKVLDTPKISIDNNLIYITCKNKELSIEESLGLLCILNSKQFDLYYRMINSSHTINIYELESMFFPNLKTLQKIGAECINKELTIEFCTRIFEKYFSKLKK